MSAKRALIDYILNEDMEQAEKILMRARTYSENNMKYLSCFYQWADMLKEWFLDNEPNDLTPFFEFTDYKIDLVSYNEKTNTFNLYYLDTSDSVRILYECPTMDAWAAELTEHGYNVGKCILFKFPICRLRQRSGESFRMYLDRVAEWANNDGQITFFNYCPKKLMSEDDYPFAKL